MNTQKIIVTFFIVFLSLFFIINATYTFRSEVENPTNGVNKTIAMTQLSQSGNEIFFSQIDDTKILSSEGLYMDTINYTDRIFSLGNSYTKKISGNNVTIKLSDEALILGDLYDISNNYTIEGKGFTLKVKSPGKILIDTRGVNVKIFSLSSVLNIVLTDNNAEMTSLALHPKMFFSFHPARNKFLKNADLLRLETLTNIFYYPGEILTQNQQISPEVLKKFNYTQDKKASNFLSGVFRIIFSPEETQKYNKDKIITTLIPVRNIKGLKYNNSYFVLFLNDQKKISYYKRKIIDQFNKGFQKDTFLNKAEILSDIETFKHLSDDEFQKFLPVLYHYYEAYLKINSLDYLKNTITLSEIIMEVNGNKKNILKSYFYLNKIYALLNNGTFARNDVQVNFLDFLKMYLDEQGISVDSTFLFKIQDTKIVGELDYLSLFIKNILLNDVSFEETQKLANILNVFKIYNNLNENINVMKNNSKSETIIIENNLILETVLSQIQKNFFQPERDEKGLLLLNKDISLSVEILNTLHTTVEKFFTFYTAKKGNLSEKNQIYNEIYEKKYALYQEYYLALSNYSSYTYKYDTLTKELFDTKTVLETRKNITLSQKHLEDYLSTFAGVNIENIKLSIVGRTYYKISNILINGEVFSFHLFPKEGNTIKEIYRSGEKLPLSYVLDDIKMIWDDALEGASDEEKELYDFRKFFINTFFIQNTKVTQKFQEEEIQLVEPQNIRLFKTEKLLGDRGEFSFVKGILDINYNNVFVTESSNGFNIQLKNIPLKTTYDYNEGSKTIMGVLNAQYVFSAKDHYFKNMTLQFFDADMYDMGDKIYLFDGKTFPINKNINIVDFKTEMNNIISSIFSNN